MFLGCPGLLLFPNLTKGQRENKAFPCCQFSQSLKINSGTYSINAGLVIVHPDIGIEVLDRRYDCLIFRVEKADPMVGIVDLESSVKEIKK